MSIQHDWEVKTSRKLVSARIRAEIEQHLEYIEPKKRKFLAQLYILGEMELSHAFGAWFKAYDGELFPIDEIMPFVIYDEERMTLTSRLMMSSEHKADYEASFKSELPMIEPPQLITDNSNNGRYQVKEHCMCGTPFARHDGDLGLDVFNFMAQQPWKLQATIEGTSKNLIGQPDYEKKQNRIREIIGDNPIWFPWCCDSRGRMYARNVWFNPQGDDAGKASIGLGEARRVETREGKFALWADLGTSLGLDKLSWVQRAVAARKAFSKGIDWALATYKPQEDINILMRTWEACEQMVNDEPVSHMVSLDATSSGMQLAGCMVGDGLTMKHTNAINSGLRSDAYGVAHEKFMEFNDTVVGFDTFDRSAFKKALMTQAYGSTKVPKEIFGEYMDLFQATMNKVFPGPMYVNRVLQALFNYQALSHEWDLPDGFHAKVPSHKVHTYDVDTEYGKVFFSADKMFPGEKDKGMAANTIHSLDAFVLREVVRLCNYDDAFLNRVHSVLFSNVEYQEIDVSLQSINILECWRKTKIASYRMLAVLAEEPSMMLLLTSKEISTLQDMYHQCEGRKIQLLTIHDAYRCHPDDAWIIRKYYKMVLANITRGDFLAHMIMTLGEGKLEPRSIDQETKDQLADLVLESVYAIC